MANTKEDNPNKAEDIGRWRTARATPKQDQYKDLDALGYMDGYEDAPDFSGVVRHKRSGFDGYNFQIRLMNMKVRFYTNDFLLKAFPNENQIRVKTTHKIIEEDICIRMVIF